VDDIWIGYATVGPLGAAAGGIVAVVGVADTDAAFREQVEHALATASLDLLELEDVETLRSHSDRHGLSATLTALVVDALRTSEVAVGDLYTYASVEDDEGPIREALASAVAEAALVNIDRYGGRSELSGFVVGLGDAWLLLHLVGDGAALGGWTAMPISDVKEVAVIDEAESFLPRALRLRGVTPEPLRDLALGGPRPLVSSAQSLFPVVTLHLERSDDICYIGRVEDVDDEFIALRLLSPAARWEETERFPVGEVSRVEFGGPYETALVAVAAEEDRGSETG
jgi:hypothetical protein